MRTAWLNRLAERMTEPSRKERFDQEQYKSCRQQYARQVRGIAHFADGRRCIIGIDGFPVAGARKPCVDGGLALGVGLTGARFNIDGDRANTLHRMIDDRVQAGVLERLLRAPVLIHRDPSARQRHEI